MTVKAIMDSFKRFLGVGEDNAAINIAVPPVNFSDS